MKDAASRDDTHIAARVHELLLLCGACWAITPEHHWNGLCYADDCSLTEAFDDPPLLQCPACDYLHRDDDADPGVWGGSQQELERVRAQECPIEQEATMASTRCKFRCGTVIDNGYGGKTISLNAMYAPDDPESENGQFWTATPSGLIQLQVNNPDGAAVFETGKDYYVDFTPAL